MLEVVTFTGVDETTSLRKLKTIHTQYPKAEFAVLIGDQTGRRDAQMRFPNLNHIVTFRDQSRERGLDTAVHLCGRWARAAVGKDDEIEATTVITLCEGFARVQLNVPGGYFTNEAQGKIGLDRFADQAGCAHVIVQRRSSEEPAPSSHPKVEYLWDRSAGTGQENFESWPAPRSSERRCGYAGGIGPSNIAQALRFVERHSEHPIWLDMESSLRSWGWFNPEAVERVCETAFGTPETANGRGQ